MKHLKSFQKIFENDASYPAALTVDVKGTDGHLLFAVIFVDADDSEDSRVEFWRARDAEHLEATMREDYVGPSEDPSDRRDTDDEEYSDDWEHDDSLSQKWEEDWDHSILPFQIGRIG